MPHKTLLKNSRYVKKLTKPDVSVDLKDTDFAKLDLKDKEFHPDYFIFQVEALKQIRQALDNPQFYKHFILAGDEGAGKEVALHLSSKRILY